MPLAPRCLFWGYRITRLPSRSQHPCVCYIGGTGLCRHFVNCLLLFTSKCTSLMAQRKRVFSNINSWSKFWVSEKKWRNVNIFSALARTHLSRHTGNLLNLSPFFFCSFLLAKLGYVCSLWWSGLMCIRTIAFATYYSTRNYSNNIKKDCSMMYTRICTCNDGLVLCKARQG